MAATKKKSAQSRTGRALALTTALTLLTTGLTGCWPKKKKRAPGAQTVASISVDWTTELSVNIEDGRHVFQGQVEVSGVSLSTGGAVALTEADVSLEVLLDGEALDSESLLDESELDSELLLTMVLDASYSMVVDHTPRAFEPMLGAAQSSARRILDQWRERGDDAFQSWVWFDDYIYDPYGSADYNTANITLIPAPDAGTDTRLYGAMNFMLDRHESLRAQGNAAGLTDRHIMIVFTDGADNRSQFVSPVQTTVVQEPFRHQRSRPDTESSLTSVADRLMLTPYLTAYIIAFGSDVNAQDLQALAQASASAQPNGGAGLENFRTGQDTANIQTIFDAISQQIQSVRNVGARDPRPLIGQHEITIRAISKADNSVIGQSTPKLFAGGVPQ